MVSGLISSCDKSYFIKKVQQRRNILSILLFIIPFLFFILFLCGTIGDDLVNIDTLLSKIRYEKGVKDSFLYGGGIFAIEVMIIYPMIIVVRNYFKRYISIIEALSDNDFEILLTLNDKTNSLAKYSPTYLIKDGNILISKSTVFYSINIQDIVEMKYEKYRKYEILSIYMSYQKKPEIINVSNFDGKATYWVQECKKINPEIESNLVYQDNYF